MTTWYVAGEFTGNAAFPTITGHPNSGRAQMCGPDTANPDAGNDSNTGDSPSQAFATLDQSFFTPQPGDTVKLAGRIRADITSAHALLVDDGGGGVRFEQWEGKAPACVRAELKAGTTGWAGSSNGFAKTIDTTLSIYDVAWDWDLAANVNTSGASGHGLRWSHLVPPSINGIKARGAWATVPYAIGDSVTESGTTYICLVAHTGGVFADDLAAAKWETYATRRAAVVGGSSATRGAWVYNFANGELVVRLPGNVSPATPSANGVEYVLHDRTAIRFAASGGGNNTSVIFDGITFQRWNDARATSPAGNSVFVANGVSCEVDGCVFEEAGDHACAFGSKVLSNTVHDCGFYGAANGSFVVVFNASGGGNSSTSCRCYSNIARISSLLDHGGLTVNRSTGTIFGYVHGAHTSVEWYDNDVELYIPPSGSPDTFFDYHSADATAPSNLHAWNTYPVIVRSCTTTNATYTPDQGVTSYIAWINCDRDSGQQDALSNGVAIELTSVTGVWIYVGCDITTTLRNTNGQAICSVWKIGAASSVYRYNCSVYDYASAHTDAKIYAIDWLAHANADVFDNGSILGYRTAEAATETLQVSAGDAAIAASAHDYNDCLYFNVSADAWSSNASFDTPTEWLANVDTGRVDNGTTSPFSDATGADLALTATAQALRKFLSTHADNDIQGNGYAGNYGERQYPTGGNMFDSWMRRRMMLRRRKREKALLEDGE